MGHRRMGIAHNMPCHMSKVHGLHRTCRAAMASGSWGLVKAGVPGFSMPAFSVAISCAVTGGMKSIACQDVCQLPSS